MSCTLDEVKQDSTKKEQLHRLAETNSFFTKAGIQIYRSTKNWLTGTEQMRNLMIL
jgi:hypothetical protein